MIMNSKIDNFSQSIIHDVETRVEYLKSKQLKIYNVRNKNIFVINSQQIRRWDSMLFPRWSRNA